MQRSHVTMTLRTVLAHLAPLARSLRRSVLRNGADPALLFDSIVEGAYLVAAADGTVDATELASIKSAVHVLTEDEIAEEDVDQLLGDLVDLRSREGEDARCAVVGKTLAESDTVTDGVRIAAAIAYVSAGLDLRELAVLHKIATAAGMAPSALTQVVNHVRDEIAQRKR